MVGRIGYGDTWHTITPYLRARMRPSGIEVQGMQPAADGGEGEPVDHCGWVLSEVALCDLVILASAHAGADDETKALLRDQLARFLRGGFLEKGEAK